MSTLKFCAECNNIMYPAEDREARALVYACSLCKYQAGPYFSVKKVGSWWRTLKSYLSFEEVAEDSIVYRMEIKHSGGVRPDVLENVAADSTLPRTKNVKCANCGHGEAVFFQAPAKGEMRLALFFVCSNPACGHRWRD